MWILFLKENGCLSSASNLKFRKKKVKQSLVAFSVGQPFVEELPRDRGSTTDLLVEFHVEDALPLGGMFLW